MKFYVLLSRQIYYKCKKPSCYKDIFRIRNSQEV